MPFSRLGFRDQVAQWKWARKLRVLKWEKLDLNRCFYQIPPVCQSCFSISLKKSWHLLLVVTCCQEQSHSLQIVSFRCKSSNVVGAAYAASNRLRRFQVGDYCRIDNSGIKICRFRCYKIAWSWSVHNSTLKDQIDKGLNVSLPVAYIINILRLQMTIP